MRTVALSARGADVIAWRISTSTAGTASAVQTRPKMSLQLALDKARQAKPNNRTALNICVLPNGSRLSCGATLEYSQMQFYLR
jgi:hypothetical protein